jgi:hypothetical protein
VEQEATGQDAMARMMSAHLWGGGAGGSGYTQFIHLGLHHAPLRHQALQLTLLRGGREQAEGQGGREGVEGG